MPNKKPAVRSKTTQTKTVAQLKKAAAKTQQPGVTRVGGRASINDKRKATAGRDDGTGQAERGYRLGEVDDKVTDVSANKNRRGRITNPLRGSRGSVLPPGR